MFKKKKIRFPLKKQTKRETTLHYKDLKGNYSVQYSFKGDYSVENRNYGRIDLLVNGITNTKCP